MLSIAGGIAVLGLVEWLLVTGWLSTSPLAWQYNFWAFVVVFVWAQPWSRRDPYRTGNPAVRYTTYAALALASLASSLIFRSLPPLVICLEILVLALIEFTGRRSVRS
jgi:hypothetical protein